MLWVDSPVTKGVWAILFTSTLDALHADPNSPSKPSKWPKEPSAKGPSVSVVERSEGGLGFAAGRLDPENTVTPIQLELLALYASGYSYDQIGSLKFRSPYTVRNTLLLAQRRAGARNLVHLVSAVVQAQMIRLNKDGIWEPVQDMRIAGE